MRRMLPILCLCWQIPVSVFPAPAPTPAEDLAGDFLFLIDTSFSMARERLMLTNTVASLIISGANGRMRAGQTYSVWMFNEDVLARRITRQTWSPEQSRRLAGLCLQFLKSQRFEKQTRLAAAVAEMHKAVRPTKPITILLFSDGDDRIDGTVFDRSINLVYQEKGRDARRARKPIITTFVGQDGRLVAWAVSVAGGPINIPEAAENISIAEKPAPVPIAPTNAPPVLAVRPEPIVTTTPAKPAAPSPEPPQIQPEAPKPAATLFSTSPALAPAPPPKEKARDTEPTGPPPAAAAETPVATAKLTVPTPTRSDPPPEATAPAPPALQPKTDSPAPTPPPTVKTEPIVTPPAPSQQPDAKVQFSLEPVRTKPKPLPEPPPPTSTATSTIPVPVAQPALAVASEPTSNSRTFFIAGVALLSLALGLIYWQLKSTRSPRRSSLISRSFDRDQK